MTTNFRSKMKKALTRELRVKTKSGLNQNVSNSSILYSEKKLWTLSENPEKPYIDREKP